MTKNKEIFRVLNKLAVPCNIIGRELLECSIEYVMEHGRTNFSKELYPYLSRTFDMNNQRINRSLNVAIQRCLNESEYETLNDIFGNVYCNTYNLTIQSFVYGVISYLKLQEETEV